MNNVISKKPLMGDINDNDSNVKESSASRSAEQQQLTLKKERLFKVIVVGDSHVGKSSFIFRYVHGKYLAGFKPTIGVDFALKTISKPDGAVIRLQIWDIAGQERFGSLTRVYYRDAAACIIMFDVTDIQTFHNAAKWKDDVSSKVHLKNGAPVPCMLLGNKTDLPHRCITDEQLKSCSKDKSFVGWSTMSVKENTNLDAPMMFLVETLLTDGMSTNSPCADDFTTSDGNIRLPDEMRTPKTMCC